MSRADAGHTRRAGAVLPAIYAVDISHVRAQPVRHDVRHASYLWFVDLDELPSHGPLARFCSRDHLGDPTRSLRENVDDYLAENGIDLQGGRVTMLTNARSLGYVFNPLSLFWCHDRSGAVVCVIAEVHNTYAQRHRYLLRPDDAGRVDVEKQFYVSPFYPVDGSYRMSVPEPDDTLAITITLHRPGQRPFTASVRGVHRPATRRAVLAAGLRHPFETWLVRALITVHGIRLWRKGLPIQDRPPHPSDSHPSDSHPSDSQLSDPTRPEAVVVAKKAARNTVADRLAGLVKDTAGIELPVRIRAWDGSEAGPSDGPVLIIRSRRALRRLLWAPGELGLARAYVTGDIDVDGDLADGFRRAWTMARARPTTGIDIGARGVLKAAAGALRLGAIGPAPKPPASEARLRGRLHSVLRDRAAISHHYDLSNDFYELLLDDHMAYSSAYYSQGVDSDQSLHDAQTAKLDLVCRKLELKPGMRLLDVGCGWGSMILHAAEHYGVHAVGITLSAQQRDFIVKRIAERGLSDRVEVRLQDYRDFGATGETFDAVSSIEMGEHVGEGQYPEYVRIMFDALKPTGRLLLQQMSRAQDTQPGGGAFIESYIAPDMYMRPIWHTIKHLVDGGFEVRDVEAMREHYVRTVADWIDTFESRWDEFVALQSEEVARVWRLYLVGGMLTFDEARMGVDQFLAVKATPEGRAAMPAARPWATG